MGFLSLGLSRASDIVLLGNRVIQPTPIMPHAIADEESAAPGSSSRGSFNYSTADPALTDVANSQNEAASGPVNGDRPLYRTGDDARIGDSGSSIVESSSFANSSGTAVVRRDAPQSGASQLVAFRRVVPSTSTSPRAENNNHRT